MLVSGFRLRIVGECQVEAVGRADAGAEAGVQAGSIKRAAVRLPQHVRGGDAWIEFRHSAGRKQRTLTESVWRQRLASQIVHAKSRGEVEAARGIPAILRKKSQTGARKNKGHVVVIGEYRCPSLVRGCIQTPPQRNLCWRQQFHCACSKPRANCWSRNPHRASGSNNRS